MLRVIRGFEGDLSERGLHRQITEYEFTCDKCGAELSLEDKVFDYGDGQVCEECLHKEFLVGDVESLLDSMEV